METLWMGVFVVLFLFMHAIAHRGCAVNTVRESALKVHWEKKKERKNHAATAADSNLREYGARLFGPTLYQLGCPDGIYVPYIKSFYLLAV